MTDAKFSEIKMEDLEEVLAHHGVKDMHWGIWNDETKRKYGVLGSSSSRAKKAGDTSVDAKPDRPESATTKPSLVQRGKNAIDNKRQQKKEAEAEEARKAAEAEALQKAKAAEEAEIQRKYGMSKQDYEALREKTLNSHDPRVIAKGMHVLTDDELVGKINRLEKEQQVKSLATKSAQEAASQKKADFEKRQQSLAYKIGSDAAKSVANAAVNTAIQKGVNPLVSAVSGSLAKSGTKALDSLKKRVGESAKPVSQSVKTAKETVASEAAVVKATAAQAKKPKGSKGSSQQSAGKKAATIRNDLNAGYGKELYDRMKAANRERVDKSDPSLPLNYNTGEKPKKGK